MTDIFNEKSVTKITILFLPRNILPSGIWGVAFTREHPRETSSSALLGLIMALKQHERYKPYILVLLVN